MIQAKKYFSKNNSLKILFHLICFVVAGRLVVRCLQGFDKLSCQSFPRGPLLLALSMSLFLYLFIIFLAFLCSKSFARTSLLVNATGIMLFFYMIALLNAWTVQIPDSLFLRGMLGGLFLFFGYLLFSRRKNPGRFFEKSFTFSVEDILIFLWFIHSFVYFLEYNFVDHRIPYADENTFWYLAAANIIERGILQSHLWMYPAGGHALGIPFMAALPAKVFGASLVQSVFFFPVVVILFLTLFLNGIRSKKWCFLFFILALFSSFNTRGWLGQLTYQLIYGESISMVLFLVVIYSLRQFMEKNDIHSFEVFYLSFFIGLLSLTKYPLAAMPLVFFVSLWGFVGLLPIRKTLLKGKIILVSVAFFLTPILLWKLFAFSSGVASHSAMKTLGNYTSVNRSSFGQLWGYMQENASAMIYFSLLSIAFILTDVKRKQSLCAVPIFLFISAVFLYYAWFYQGNDSASSLRYMMICIPALFYLGAESFDRIIRKVEQKPWPYFVKLPAVFLLAGLLTVKLF